MSDLQIKEDYQNSEPIAEQPDLQPKGIHQIIWDEDQVRKFFQIHKLLLVLPLKMVFI